MKKKTQVGQQPKPEPRKVKVIKKGHQRPSERNEKPNSARNSRISVKPSAIVAVRASWIGGETHAR